MHLRPFGSLTKLGAKHSELVQKFVRRSRVGVFHDERTRSTPLDPKLMFCCVSYHLGAFGTVWLPYETRCKTGRTRAKVCATKSRQNFSQQTHPMVRNGPKHEFRIQWGGSGAFVANSSCHEGASEFFATNPLDPLHWILNSCLGAFCTVWVHLRPINCLTKLGAKHFELVQKFVPRRRVRVFRDERPIHPIGP